MHILCNVYLSLNCFFWEHLLVFQPHDLHGKITVLRRLSGKENQSARNRNFPMGNTVRFPCGFSKPAFLLGFSQDFPIRQEPERSIRVFCCCALWRYSGENFAHHAAIATTRHLQPKPPDPKVLRNAGKITMVT